jgi:hypothetical protein
MHWSAHGLRFSLGALPQFRPAGAFRRAAPILGGLSLIGKLLAATHGGFPQSC